ncbi:MAG: hypothetical protein ABI456_14295 [Ktedonobacteraceae bacterium]
MLQSTITRAFALGLGYGTLWLVSACIAFGILDMVEINTTLAGSVLSILVTLLIGGILLFLCLRFLRLGYALPKTEDGKISPIGRRIFGLLILLEIIGWTVLNIGLGSHKLQVWIVPIDLLIIAIHFIPLAFVFKVPAYLVMGICWVTAIIGSMLVLPSTMVIGHSSAWTTIPSICCILLTWLTALYLIMTESRKVRAVFQTI